MLPRIASDHTVLVVWVGGHFVTHSVRCGWVEPVEAGSDPFRVPGQDAGWVYPNKQNRGPIRKENQDKYQDISTMSCLREADHM